MSSDTLLECEDCGWTGYQAECIRYGEILGTGGEVEPYLECPKCNGGNLIELAGRSSVLVPAFT